MEINTGFLDSKIPLQQRVDILVDQMTLEEKIEQLYDKSPAIKRLGIPKYAWWNEALHGVARAGTATVFPQAIGLAASFDESLVLNVAETISTEARAKHEDFLSRSTRSMYTGLNFWSPNINIFRDPRWGRGQETYGEDPFLTGRTAINFVNGLQGSHPEYLKTGATIKHYAVHSGPEPSRHSDNYTVSDYDLYSTYLPAFKAVIEKTNIHAIMCAYNAVNGEPACANRRLIKDILVNEFGFNGYIVSDCGAIADFYKPDAHAYVATKAEAAAAAVKSGVHIECGDGDGSVFKHLREAIDLALVSEEDITAAVKRLYRARFQLGMFDNEFIYRGHSIDLVGSKAHLALSAQAARKALVLLKNDGVLPLNKNQKIALIGPNANNVDILVANYHGQPVNPQTPLQSLKAELGNNLSFSPGSALAEGFYSHYQAVSNKELLIKDANGFKHGVKAEFFDTVNNTGKPVKVNHLANINNRWIRTPISHRDDDNFSVKYSGYLALRIVALTNFSGNVTLFIEGKEITGPITLHHTKHYAYEAHFTSQDSWHSNAIQPQSTLTWINTDVNLEQSALEQANMADIIVFMGGISASLEGEEMSVDIDGFHGGDRTHIDIPAPQLKLLKKIKALNKPLVYVNFSGGAVDLSWPKANANAVIQGFYPGEATGNAITDLLLGNSVHRHDCPLPFTQSVDDLPDFKEYSMVNRTHRFFTGKPVFHFGEGMGYATINSKIVTAPKTHNIKNDLELTIALENNSHIDAEEVIQVYVEPKTHQSREIQALKAFKSVAVKANHSTHRRLIIPHQDLYFINENGTQEPYSGDVTFRLGFSPSINAQRITVSFIH